MKCVEYFKARSHDEIMVFVPQHRQGTAEARNVDVLKKLEKSGHMVFTPTGRIQGVNFSSYDDRSVTINEGLLPVEPAHFTLSLVGTLCSGPR
jgi:hypothetical protein